MSKDSVVEQIKKITGKIEGWLSNSEGDYLYSIAKDGPAKGVIVEIGSWEGKATIWLAIGTKQAKREKVYAIDYHRGSAEHGNSIWTYPEFKSNIENANVDDVVVPIVMKSQDAVKNWDKPIRFLWIDGAHTYTSVKQDFLLWQPYLVDGGIIAFHDTTTWPGPKKLIEEYICNSNKFKKIGFVGSITFAEKVAGNSIIDRFQNRLNLSIRDIALEFKLPRYFEIIGRKILIFLHLHQKIS
jgi:predicted O-methyltransferase YrrM